MKRILLLSVALMFMAFSCTPKESETFHQHIKVTNNAEYSVYVLGGGLKEGRKDLNILYMEILQKMKMHTE